MNSKLKILSLDLFIGVIALFIVYIIATYIHSNESVITITIVIIFMAAGMLRGKYLNITSWIRIIMIDLSVILYLPLINDLSLTTIQYPIVALLSTIIGFIIGIKWENFTFTKKIISITLPLIIFIFISLFILPSYLY